ncbi:MAG: nucleotide exchange factor GrpE [Rickettsiales bacterium]
MTENNQNNNAELSEANSQNPSENQDSNNKSNGNEQNLINKIQELEQKNTELNDKLLRNLAEIENIRKRAREESDKASKYAISGFVSDLVVVCENFFMAQENSPKNEIENNSLIKNYATAIEMTQKELLKVLEKNNVKRIFPLNQDFDHNFHEAIAHIESDSKAGSVVQVIQAGYSIAERLIRPALVGVAKAKGEENNQ